MKNSTALPAVNNCVTGTVNLILHSLFKGVTVQFNNNIVSDPSNMYAYRAYMETLLSCSSDVHSYRLKAEGWHKDTYDKISELEPKTTRDFSSERSTAPRVQILCLLAARM